jgi:hypothetical protein
MWIGSLLSHTSTPTQRLARPAAVPAIVSAEESTPTTSPLIESTPTPEATVTPTQTPTPSIKRTHRHR